MNPRLPGWLARLLGRPGSSSFDGLWGFVRDAALLETELLAAGDEELRQRLAAAAAGGQAGLAALLAGLREAARRTLGLRAHDEQLLAAAALLHGFAVEQDTGEGKTLTGVLAAAGQALRGGRVHLLSVNDYLAQRDAEWSEPLFELIGVSCGWIGQHTPAAERREVYARAVVYAPVSELGYDVLRDRFVDAPGERVAPVFDVAIVDEADAVMLDEAVSPLVLAGADDGTAAATDVAVDTAAGADADGGTADTAGIAAADGDHRITRLVEGLRPDQDFTVDAEQSNVTLSDEGLDRLERALGGIDLYAEEHLDTLTRLNLALHARVLVRRDVDYVVADGAIRLINTGRGRIAALQRWPDGLHAAIEAKERLAPSAPGVVLDSITVQALLGQYRLLSGMSGTVLAVAEELAEFYELRAGRVERRLEGSRVDLPDRILVDAAAKERTVVAEVVARHAEGQPVLLGTQSVAESEHYAQLLARAGVVARVLNARNDAAEAAIIARAGEWGAVTISTQLSGRGTDIRLGGPDERDRDRVVAAGGLAVIATGRHHSRRLDAQLRGRAGRQQDPGTSILIASLQDELVQTSVPTFQLTQIERRGESLTAAERARILDSAQGIAESVRLDRHRATWRYHRVITRQRTAVLAHREEVLDGTLAADRVRERLPERLHLLERHDGAEAVGCLLRTVRLHRLDEHWQQHLALLAQIRDGIHLRALAGQDPADEFHLIALREFDGFLGRVDADVEQFARSLGPGDAARDPAELGLRRPSATWTYMVTDDPFGSPGDRAVRALGGLWRRHVLHAE